MGRSKPPRGYGLGEWSSLEEARESGELRAQFVQEWVAYLEANGRTFRDDS